jgi:uncharacterized oligopeptide transporter (OPT) family protein
MWFFYFLPMLVAIAFLLAKVARGGSLTPRASWRQAALGVLAVVVLGVLGAALAGVLR